MATEGHDPATGRFIKGNKPAGHRPLGSVNKISKSVNAEVREGLGSIADAVKELRKTNLSAVVPLIRHMMLSADADAVVASSLSLPADITIVAVPVGHHFFKIDALTLGLFDADQANQVCKLELKENETAILFGRRFINLNRHLSGLFTDDEMQWARQRLESQQQPEVDLSNVTVLKPTGNV
jgi:hypothetical protein